MKQLFTFIILFGGLLYFLKSGWEQKTIETDALTLTEKKQRGELPSGLVQLPVGDRVYFSACPEHDDVQGIHELGVIEVIRLNGTGKDAGPLILNDEAMLCDSNGMRLRYYNIDGGDSLETVVRHLEDGRVLVHCKNGVHRAALVAGCYLLKQGHPLDDVLDIIGWRKGTKPILTDPRYAKYVYHLNHWAKLYGSPPTAAI